MLEAFDGTNVTLTECGAAERLSVMDVTPGFFSVLGIAPALGRAFNPEDLGQPVVVISDSFWRGKLGAEPNAIGRRLMLGGRAHSIVGVLPERFFFSFNPSEIWRPLPLLADDSARRSYRVLTVARLGAGVPATALEAAVNAPIGDSTSSLRVASEHVPRPAPPRTCDECSTS